MWGLVFAIPILAACSGGGGGTAALPAPTAAAPSLPTSPAPLSFLPRNSTVTYQAASATALATNAGMIGSAIAGSGQGATITISEGANGVNKVDLNIPTSGATFTQQYSYSVWDDSGPFFTNVPTAAHLTTILRDVFGFPNTTGTVITQSIGAQSLNSSAYGLWASGDTATAGRTGTFAFGNQTPTASVPGTGSATYNGATIGIGGATNGSNVYAVQGKVQIIANFVNQSVSSNLTNLSTQNISNNAIGSLPDLAGTSAIAGNAYSGPIAGGGFNGTINGNFYGSAAQETAGVWHASGGGNSWVGSFGAK